MRKLIVGLGNPGIMYRNTRHNIGKTVVRELAELYKIKLKKDKTLFASLGRGKIREVDFILAYPLVYMNLSGKAIRCLVDRFGIENKNLLVICDDLDLKLGRLRIKPKGGDGGHRGLRSVIEELGSSDFCRLRIGIGRILDKEKIKDFVLSGFSAQERSIVEQAKHKVFDCCRVWLLEGIDSAMNKFN